MHDAFDPSGGGRGSAWITVPDLIVGLMVAFVLLIIAAIPPLTSSSDAKEAAPAPRQETDFVGLQAMRQQLANQQLQFQQALEEHERQTQNRLAEQAMRLTQSSRQINDIARAWEARNGTIHDALIAEFSADLAGWNAEIRPDTLLIRFASPDVLFEKGKADLSEDFSGILSDFFPRYVAVLEPFKQDIEEIRIEGHTSSTWGAQTPKEEAFYKNMALSQRRTMAVMQYVNGLDDVLQSQDWLRPLLTANGLSSSRPILRNDGTEDPDLSRRVEFRIRTSTQEDMRRISDLTK